MEQSSFGRCFLSLPASFAAPLSEAVCPRFDQLEKSLEDEDDEFGDWCSFLPEWGTQLETRLTNAALAAQLMPLKLGGDVIGYHVVQSGGTTLLELVASGQIQGWHVIGAAIQDIVDAGQEMSSQATDYALMVLANTTALNADAADNYAKMGDMMEDVHERGGFRHITRSVFVTVTQHLVSRWTGARESVAAARIAASLIYDSPDEPWSPQMFNEAMEVDEDEDEKQSRLVRMCGMIFRNSMGRRLEERRRRRVFNVWRADALAPAKAFCRAVGVSDEAVDQAADSALANSIPMIKWASGVLATAATTAVKTTAVIAGGGVVSVAVFAAAGLLMDWYYEDKASKRLGGDRFDDGAGMREVLVKRVTSYFTAAAHMSDEVYDCTSSTQVVRVDPFFFIAKRDVAKMKDDTAAQRSLTNSLLPPILQTISSANKTLILLPGSISDDSAQHLQQAMPEFYFRIVNRNHSHPELWATRRGFEMMVARAVAADESMKNVVMIGGSTRQVCKIPNVVLNYGPQLSGRDEFRHSMKGTVQQRGFFSAVTVQKEFGDSPNVVSNGVGVSFYSAQDIHKNTFIWSAIRMGLRKCYLTLNIPVMMKDKRVVSWDDRVLNARYRLEGDDMYMSPIALPVAGYKNSLAKTLSWVEPHSSFKGFDITVSALAQVGSSYLLEMDIGVGAQEGYETIWRMPDSGYYVLHDLTREHGDIRYYTVPAAKFDTTVKYIIQMSASKTMLEAAAGRISGLEAQVKIGSTILERSWEQDHRQFSSSAVHAMICAGLDKSDALYMLGKMRLHFSEPSSKTLLTRVLSGYAKFAGLEADNRYPGKSNRGASDYEPVTHWTSRQHPGQHAVVEHSYKIAPVVAEQGEVVEKPRGERASLHDEGYVSAEVLNSDDAEDGESESSGDVEPMGDLVEEPTLVVRLTNWATKLQSREVGKTAERADSTVKFQPNDSTRVLQISDQDANALTTTGQFNPGGGLFFGGEPTSLQDEKFKERFASRDDVAKALENSEEFPSPDCGVLEVLEMAYARPSLTVANPYTLHRPIQLVGAESEMDKLYNQFISDVDDSPEVARPFLLIDGISGSAKSSIVRSLIQSLRVSTAVVIPTKALAKEWRKHHVGTCVTRHKLSMSTLRGRSLLVIDEVYAYTKAELFTLLFKAAKAKAKVICLGDRQQQYEDGSELIPQDLQALGVPVLRVCVSNTMPVDSLYIAKWAAESDAMSELFQTRSTRVHSIYVKQKDELLDRDEVLGLHADPDSLTYKDKLQVPLDWDTIEDGELGFDSENPEAWLSVSRTQGLRTKDSLFVTSKRSKAEKWFSDQRGLLYVATSRHSQRMVWYADQYDLFHLGGLTFENPVIVRGRLALAKNRERFEMPHTVRVFSEPKKSAVLDKLAQRGMTPQVARFQTSGVIREDWRPWHKFAKRDASTAISVFADAARRLVGSEVPYVQTGAIFQPTYAATQGLFSVRRPELRQNVAVDSAFVGLDRLAVLQDSKDELLDQKNVIERAARPKVLDERPWVVGAKSTALFKAFVKCFLIDDGEVPLSVEPSAEDWASSRTPGYLGKFVESDPYGLTGFSVRSQGFLKTQTKVKLKRTFALEENYGQTVLASPADFNAKFGPWSKMFLRNLRLMSRRGAVFDSGYSDAELAREMRRLGLLGAFLGENYQADVKRQDTSHTPVTLAVFCMVMEYLAVPGDLVQVYWHHSKHFEYQSMKAGLYRGKADYNLGSGDPFTLIRNICEVLTVMLERYGNQMKDMFFIVKGDDFLSNKIPELLPVFCQELRSTQLTEDFNAPPYHAGRFFISDDILPDPVKMVVKAMVKRSDSVDRVNQLSQAFYDRYIPLTGYSYNEMRHYVIAAYSDFEPEVPLAALDLYHALRDRNKFYDLVSKAPSLDGKLVVLDNDDDCAAKATAWFSRDLALVASVREETMDVVRMHLARHNIPTHVVRGTPNDFLKRGVWLSPDHAWAVVGLTEFKESSERASVIEVQS